MPDHEAETRECPYCKEDVKAGAIRCKHCHAQIAPVGPTHQGVCPFCKEDIKVDAIRCKHCHADLRPGVRAGVGGCCGTCGGGQRLRPTRLTKRIARDIAYRDNPPLSAACHGCPLTDTDGYGTWCLESCDETTCTLWLCEPTTEPGILV